MKFLSNKILRIITVAILILSVSISSVACKKEETKALKDPITYQGTHIYTAPDVETDDYILENGRFNYTLVLPSQMSESLEIAKNEFTLLFKRATGVEITSIRRDNGIVYNENDRYISFGDNELVVSAGITYDKKALKLDGARIITKGKSIFFLGGSDTGVIAAVYDFMQICFNYEYYYRNCIEIDTGVVNLKLKNFDVTDIPDIDVRDISHADGYKYNGVKLADIKAYGDTAVQEVYNRQARYRDFSDLNTVQLPIYPEFGKKENPMGFHNALDYFPRGAVSPSGIAVSSKWFSNAGEQLCYTAGGDTESRRNMIQFAAEKVINTLTLIPVADNPYANTITLTAEDNGDHCNCAQCAEEKQHDGGSGLGAIIRFINEMMEIVYEWMEQPENEPYRRDDLVCYFFSYSSFTAPPVKYDEKARTWEFIEGCEMGPHTGVYYAPSSDLCFYASAENEVNNRGLDYLQIWDEMSDNLWFWGYGGFHKKSVYYMNTENLYTNEFFARLANANCSRFFDEVLDGGEAQTAWNNLKAYMHYKLSWDCTLNKEELMENYMNAMYRDAAETMTKLYKEHRAYFDYSMTIKEQVKVGNTFFSFFDRIYEYPVLKNYIAMIDQALKDIEKYKTLDPDLHYVLENRINLEAVSYIYMMIDICGNSKIPDYDEDTKTAYKNRLYNILLNWPELGSVSNATNLAIDICFR